MHFGPLGIYMKIKHYICYNVEKGRCVVYELCRNIEGSKGQHGAPL